MSDDTKNVTEHSKRWDLHMATGVGLFIGGSESIAAIVTTGRESNPVFVLRESVLHMSTDGAAVLGGTADAGYGHTISDFVSFVGSPAGIVVDDSEPYRAEDLVATALFCLINLATDYLSGPAEFHAAYPAHWPDEYVALLREALDYLGLRSVVLAPAAPGDATQPIASADKQVALSAALAAHTAVMSTPAGSTPPDVGPSTNSALTTTELPPLAPAFNEAQAYSAALPLSSDLPTEAEPRMRHDAAPPTLIQSSSQATSGAASTSKSRRNVMVLAAAAAVLLALGGISAFVAVNASSDGGGEDAKAATSSSQVTTTPLPPLPPPPAPAPVAAPVTQKVAPKRPVAPIHSPTPAKPPPPPPTSSTATTTTTSPSSPGYPYSPYDPYNPNGIGGAQPTWPRPNITPPSGSNGPFLRFD